MKFKLVEDLLTEDVLNERLTSEAVVTILQMIVKYLFPDHIVSKAKPNALVIHHINGRKKEHDLENLCLMLSEHHDMLHANSKRRKGNRFISSKANSYYGDIEMNLNKYPHIKISTLIHNLGMSIESCSIDEKELTHEN